MAMATGWDTKATQTEEEEENYLPVTTKDVEFKCREGINAKLKTFNEVHKKAVIVQIELDGHIYSGVIIEAINSFAPVNLNPPNRRFPITYKTAKAKKIDVKKPKKPNVYSRENYPKGYIDPHNTIKARLRFGRDKRISSTSTSSVERGLTSHAKDCALLKSNRKSKSRCYDAAANSASNEDSPYRMLKMKSSSSKKDRERYEDEINSEATTSNKNLPLYPTFEGPSTTGCYKAISPKQNKEKGVASSNTSFYSPKSKVQGSARKYETEVNPVSTDHSELVQISHDQGEIEPDLITFSPIMDTKLLCKSNDDVLQSESSSEVSRFQSSEPDLITFSPKSNSETHCKNSDGVVQSAPPCHVSQDQCLNLELSFSLQTIDAKKEDCGASYLKSATSREAVSHHRRHSELDYPLGNIDETQYAKSDSKLPENEIIYFELPKSKLQTTPRTKEILSLADFISVKNTLNENLPVSSETKLQCNPRNVKEIQCLDDLKKTETLNDKFHHSERKSSPGKRGETKIFESSEDLKCMTARESSQKSFESMLVSPQKVDAQDNSHGNKVVRSSDETAALCFKSDSRNNSEKGKIRSSSTDRTVENTELPFSLQLLELNLPINIEQQRKDFGSEKLTTASSEFQPQKCLKLETMYSPEEKEETECNFNSKTDQSTVSNKYFTQQTSEFMLKCHPVESATQSSESSTDLFSTSITEPFCQSSEYEFQPSFKENEYMQHVEDNVQSRALNETSYKEMSEVKVTSSPEKPHKMRLFSEGMLVQHSSESQLRYEETEIENKECASSSIENEVLGDTLNQIKMFRNVGEHKGTEESKKDSTD